MFEMQARDNMRQHTGKLGIKSDNTLSSHTLKTAYRSNFISVQIFSYSNWKDIFEFCKASYLLRVLESKDMVSLETSEGTWPAIIFFDFHEPLGTKLIKEFCRSSVFLKT